MKSIAFTSLLILFGWQLSYAQELNFMLRSNNSIGFNSRTIGNGTFLTYSPGGGGGLEIGATKDLGKGFTPYLSLGYQLVFSLQSDNIGTTSTFFDRKTFGFGTHKLIPFKNVKNKKIRGLLIGFGGLYAFPSKLMERENGTRAPKITYESSLGFTIDMALNLMVSDKVQINPGIRFRQLKFDSKSVEEGELSALPSEIATLNASGLDLSFTFIFMGKSR